MSNFNQEFMAGLAARRAAKVGTSSTSAPAPVAPVAPSRPHAAPWSVIADELNSAAGFAHSGPNVAASAPRHHHETVHRAPGKAGAADWADVAATLNAEIGLTATSAGAKRHG